MSGSANRTFDVKPADVRISTCHAGLEQLWVAWDVGPTAVGLDGLRGRAEDREVCGRIDGWGAVVGVAFDGEEGDEGVDVLREEADLPAAEAQVRDAAAAGLLADPPR